MLDVAGQRLDQAPVPILYVGPNKQFLSEQFEPRVMALLDGAATLVDKVARGKRMTKTRKMVAGVPFRLAHAGSTTALKSDPAALALVDEYDEMRSNVNDQGGPLGSGRAARRHLCRLRLRGDFDAQARQGGVGARPIVGPDLLGRCRGRGH